jgi:hypothetical protein
MSAADPRLRQVVRKQLADVLGEPLERLANETRLRKLGRYRDELVRQLFAARGLEVPARGLQDIERVGQLLDAVLNARTARGAAVPPPAVIVEEAKPEPAPPPAAPEGTYTSATPYEEARVGAAALYCSDGRLGDHTDEFLHQSLSLPRYDRLACPGGPVALAGRLLAFWECRGVENQLRLLVQLHQLRTLVLIAHDGCAFYRDRLGLAPARVEGEQRADLVRAAAAAVNLGPALAVSCWYARRVDGRVRFEPVRP